MKFVCCLFTISQLLFQKENLIHWDKNASPRLSAWLLQLLMAIVCCHSLLLSPPNPAPGLQAQLGGMGSLHCVRIEAWATRKQATWAESLPWQNGSPLLICKMSLDYFPDGFTWRYEKPRCCPEPVKCFTHYKCHTNIIIINVLWKELAL